MSDSLVTQFEEGTLAPEKMTHEAHVKLAWLYLRAYPVLTALERFIAALKRFAAANGKDNLYHETITWAYMLIINERMERSGTEGKPNGNKDVSWEQFAAANPDLLLSGKHALAAYYRPETLSSELARRCFVLPDRNKES